MQDQSLGGEDPLEKEIATHSSILAWKIPWTEEPGELQSMGLQRVAKTEATQHMFVLNLHLNHENSLSTDSMVNLSSVCYWPEYL